MRTITICIAAVIVMNVLHANGQVVATFDDLPLAHPDTFYTNYTASGSDVGFNDGLARFPCVYDTSYGGFWSSGFAYSNMTDSVTSGFMNQYSAKAGRGFDSSANYVVAYGEQNIIRLSGPAMGHLVSGFYVTNNTYAYNSMRDGDMFARKFHNGDWFKLTIRGYSGGALLPDSVGVYLADFLFPDTTMNYILRGWQWVSTGSLGNVDSLQFNLTSTDNGMFGMNTPAYFCMDNFFANDPSLGLHTNAAGAVKIYPVPAGEILWADAQDRDYDRATVMDMQGREVGAYTLRLGTAAIPTGNLVPGMYMLQLSGKDGIVQTKFEKK